MAKTRTRIVKTEIQPKATKVKKIKVKDKVKAKKTKKIEIQGMKVSQKDMLKIADEINSLTPKAKAVVMETVNLGLQMAMENLTLRERVKTLEKAMKDNLAVVRVEAKKTSTTGTTRAKKTRKNGGKTIS